MMADTSLLFPQVDAVRMFDELGELRVELDDDPLVYGPKRLNTKTAEVRRMLDRCEKLFLDVSRKLQAVRRGLRVAETDLDLAKKNLFANDPETRSGRSVGDREAIASGKLETEIRGVHELNLASEDLDAVLVVIKAKRADLRDTEGRLRDQIRLCSEEIGLGGRWGSQSPHAPDFHGRPAYKTATGADVDDVTSLIQGLDGEIALSRDLGTWQDPEDLSVAPSEVQIVVPVEPSEDITITQVETPEESIEAIVTNPKPLVEMEETPVEVDDVVSAIQAAVIPEKTEEIQLEGAVSKDMSVTMAPTAAPSEVDVFLEEVTVSAAEMPKPDQRKLIDDIDVDAILSMFETI
jgi:hypothetical protein